MALVDCPECNRNVSDKAVSCPNCGYPISTSIAKSVEDVRKVQPVQTYRSGETAPAKVWVPSAEGQIANADNRKEPMGLLRYVMGIFLNIPIGGVGWLLAPGGQKWFAALFIALWTLTSFLDDSTRTLAIGAVNIGSAIYFGTKFKKLVGN